MDLGWGQIDLQGWNVVLWLAVGPAVVGQGPIDLQKWFAVLRQAVERLMAERLGL